MCGKGTEKNQMAARLDVRLRRPFLEDLGRSGRNKGASTGKRRRSELMWRQRPFWRISAAQGWKRGTAADKKTCPETGLNL